MESRLGKFHEMPLVAFSAAAIGGAGVAAARPLAAAFGLCPCLPGRKAAALVVILLGGAFLLGIRHLGRRRRMAMAFRRAGRSALSTELILASLTAAPALVLLSPRLNEAWIPRLWAIASFAALGFLFSLIRVYWLPGQVTWRGVAALSPISLSLLFGLVANTLEVTPGSPALVQYAVILLAIDAALWIARCTLIMSGQTHGVAAQPGIMAARLWIISGRSLLLMLLFPAALISGSDLLSLGLLGAGLLVDRFAFYGLALRQTSEAEVCRIETILKSISRIDTQRNA